MPVRHHLLSLRAHYHLWSGRRAYRSGRMLIASRHLGQALRCGADTFDACLLLGKICYREEDYARAAGFFERAAGQDPVRYALEGMPERLVATLRGKRRSSGRPAVRIVIQAGPEERDEAVRPVVQAATFGDFQSREEWLAHRDHPPFEPGSGADIDWDAAARDLLEG